MYAYVFSETLFYSCDGQYGELTENDVELVVRRARSRVFTFESFATDEIGMKKK